MKRLAALLLLLCLLGTAGGAGAAKVSDLRGYLAEEESYQYVQLGTYPQAEDGTPAPVVWRVLLAEDGVATVMSEMILDVQQVVLTPNFEMTQKRKYRRFVTFPESDLAIWMNGEMLDTLCAEQDFRDALVETDNGLIYPLTNAEMMNEAYGFPHTKSGSTIENPGERAVPEAKRRMAVATPWAKARVLVEGWTGLNKKLYVDENGCSPYWTATLRREDGRGWYLGIIGKNGHISWSGYGSVHIGVRPTMRLRLAGFEIRGGSGTLEEPWQLGWTGEAEDFLVEEEKENAEGGN